MARFDKGLNTEKVLQALNAVLEFELAGVVRYTHYSLMVFGHARIPIIAWMRSQATESLNHAQATGEHITTLGGHPSLKIGKLLETEQHDIDAILCESLEHERGGLALYYGLLELVKDKSVWLEEYVREQILQEESHIAEVEKMLRAPGDLVPAR